jgi:hypothetical protein
VLAHAQGTWLLIPDIRVNYALLILSLLLVFSSSSTVLACVMLCVPLQLIERNAPGYAIGGLAGGETKDMFWRVVAQCAAGLPPGKPRYVMGIGYPLDVVVCSALGADMYDSVYPTRTARFGVALVDSGGCVQNTNCIICCPVH